MSEPKLKRHCPFAVLHGSTLVEVLVVALVIVKLTVGAVLGLKLASPL
jgi:hypothetical protein